MLHRWRNFLVFPLRHGWGRIFIVEFFKIFLQYNNKQWFHPKLANNFLSIYETWCLLLQKLKAHRFIPAIGFDISFNGQLKHLINWRVINMLWLVLIHMQVNFTTKYLKYSDRYHLILTIFWSQDLSKQSTFNPYLYCLIPLHQQQQH